MIVIAVKLYGRPGTGDELAEAFAEVARPSREEPGCELYLAARSQEDPDHFLLYEHYRDAAAHAEHRETEHFKRIVEGRVMPLVERRERALYDLIAE